VIKDLRATDPELAGPYRLLGRLGVGGMGQAYLGRSAGGRLVAIKLVRAELAEEPGFRARFASEIAAARNVSGRFTVAVVGADTAAELPWLATAYVPGPSLADAVQGGGPLPAGTLPALAAGLAGALQEIHRAGVVHGDLKPSNVLLASGGPRVADFGISGVARGSAGFLSPEQARGQGEIGPASDMFSLGAVLAYAATGAGPFGAGPTPALLYRVVNEDADLTRVPAGIRPLVAACLAKDPAARPTPAGLLAVLSGEAGPLPGDWPSPGDWPLPGDWPPANLTETIGRYVPAEEARAPTPTPTPIPGSDLVPAVPPAAPATAQSVTPARDGTVAVSPGSPGGPASPRHADHAGHAGHRRHWPPAVTASAAAAIVVVAVVATLAALSPAGQKSARQMVSSVTGATQVSCQDYGSVRSSASGTGANYSFVNASPAAIQIWFLGAGGAGVLKAAVGPGGSFGRGVSTGEYWMVAGSGGGCISIIAISGSGTATVS
jgi:eukaryotic-like serine/threonine-protein kinase